MSRLLALVSAAVLAAAACSADDGSAVGTEAAPTSPTTDAPSTTTTTTPAPSAPDTSTTSGPTTRTTGTITEGSYHWDTLILPPVLLAGDGLIRLVHDGEVDVVSGVDGTAARAFATSTGTVLIDEIVETDYPSVHQYLVIGDGGDDWMLPEDPGHLFDLVDIGGIPHIVYAAGDESAEAGLFFIRDLTTGVDVSLGTAYESEYGVWAASVGGRLVAISAVADLTEIILFSDTEGNALEQVSPTDDLPYNSPPFVGPAELSPDGFLLAYVEQPDTSLESPSIPVGDTTLVIIEMATGSEDLRLPLPGIEGVEAIDYDGRWVAVSARVGESTVPYLIDTGSPALDIIELSDLDGVASLA